MAKCRVTTYENIKGYKEKYLCIKGKDWKDLSLQERLQDSNYLHLHDLAGNIDVDDEALYVDLLMRDPNNLMSISGDGSFTSSLTGYIDANSTFGASSQFSQQSPGESTPQAANAAVGHFIHGGRDVKVANSRMTRVVWNSASFNAIPFEVFFLSKRPGDDPMEEAVKIWDYVLPSLGTGVYIAPGGYGSHNTGKQKGTISLMIGSWFRAMNAFVVTNAEMEVSKQKQKDGVTPLYTRVTMTLSPSRQFTASEVKSWFISTKFAGKPGKTESVEGFMGQAWAVFSELTHLFH